MPKSRLSSSPYLTRLAERFVDIDLAATVSVQQLTEQINALQTNNFSDLHDTEHMKTQLREAKGRFALMWSLAELGQQISFSELGELQSRFADACIQLALVAAWHSKEFNKLIKTEQVDGIAPGVFVLGLGKLGGFDLNFSSDVDLIAFYDKTQFPKPRLHAATFVITRLLGLATKILTDPKGGFVWRVDWRLRPYASMRDLTMTTSAAVEFYHYHARPWHRLAMIKARVVAGDQAAGADFLDSLRSFLWRHDLDYRSIDEIADLKDKINREHPELRAQRLLQDDPLDQVPDFNLKLGYGGIREIEFLVNALQLVWGGRKPRLRITNTLSALAGLVDEGLVEEAVGERLSKAYVFFRQAENRLQMRHNDQVYRLPTEPAAQADYQVLLGYSDWAAFEQDCIAHRQQVYREFARLFAEPDTVGIDHDRSDCDIDNLNEAAQDIAERWQDGFRNYGALPDQAVELRPLAYTLCRVVEECGVDPSAAIVQIHEFFTRLPPGGQYFKLLQAQPPLIEKWLKPMLLSDSMAVLIKQTPHLIDRFLEPEAELDAEVPLDTNIVFYTDDYETRLENLRRLTNEELYFHYLHYLQGEVSPRPFERGLTRLAEKLLAVCVQVACDEMQLDSAPIAIIGFGKFGMRAMMPRSDLDLVYVFADSSQLQLANQFASRLQTVINVKMKQGRVYELDTRLRPSGQSGSVTISLESFEQHQINKAQTWSHLALFPARFVAGNAEVGARFAAIRQSVLSRRRDQQAFLLDTRSMLNRIRKQRIKPAGAGQFSAKLLPGGLMELEYLISCLALYYAPDHPELLGLDYDQAVEQLSELSGGDLASALLFLRDYQLEIRIFGRDGESFTSLPAPVQAHVLSTLGLSAEALVDKVEQTTKWVQAEIDNFYAELDVERLADWREGNIQWAME